MTSVSMDFSISNTLFLAKPCIFKENSLPSIINLLSASFPQIGNNIGEWPSHISGFPSQMYSFSLFFRLWISAPKVEIFTVKLLFFRKMLFICFLLNILLINIVILFKLQRQYWYANEHRWPYFCGEYLDWLKQYRMCKAHKLCPQPAFYDCLTPNNKSQMNYDNGNFPYPGYD